MRDRLANGCATVSVGDLSVVPVRDHGLPLSRLDRGVAVTAATSREEQAGESRKQDPWQRPHVAADGPDPVEFENR